MKKIIIKCDVCNKDIGDIHISLGNEDNNNLFYKNNLGTKPGEVESLSSYRQLHFCSKDHFIKYFFDNQ